MTSPICLAAESSHPASWAEGDGDGPQARRPALADVLANSSKEEPAFSAMHPAAVSLVKRDETLALDLKTQGNALFTKKQFIEALKLYDEAIEHAPIAPSFYKHLAVFHSNKAACLMELGRLEECAKQCTASLAFDPEYCKALLRRAKAYEQLDQLEEALQDMDAALAVDPKLPGLRADREIMDRRVKEKHEKLKDEMIGKLKEMGNMFLGKFGLSLDNFKMEQDPNTGSYSVNFKQ